MTKQKQTGGVPLEQLTIGQCHYPVSPDGQKPMLFCGAPRRGKSAYCPRHHAVCYTLVKVENARS